MKTDHNLSTGTCDSLAENTNFAMSHRTQGQNTFGAKTFQDTFARRVSNSSRKQGIHSNISIFSYSFHLAQYLSINLGFGIVCGYVF